MLVTSTTETNFDCLVIKTLFIKLFSKFYHRHSELTVKYNIGLKTSATGHIRASILL